MAVLGILVLCLVSSALGSYIFIYPADTRKVKPGWAVVGLCVVFLLIVSLSSLSSLVN